MLLRQGAVDLLRGKRATTLSFEYISRGFWDHPSLHTRRCVRHPGTTCVPPSERRSLLSVLRRLEAFGWGCYVQTRGGLVPASGACWRPAFASIGWANLLCSHDARVHTVLRSRRLGLAPTVESLVRHHMGRATSNFKGRPSLPRSERVRITKHWADSRRRSTGDSV